MSSFEINGTDVQSSFLLSDWDPPVPVTLPEGLAQRDLLGFRPFNDWKATLKVSLEKQKFKNHAFAKDPYKLRGIKVDAFDKKGHAGLLFVKMVALIQNEGGESLPGVIFLRGASIAILMVLRPTDALDERYVIMTEQARAAAGSLRFMEIPAGMIDDGDNFAGEAAREIRQEVGLTINRNELIDMTALALRGHRAHDGLRDAMYPSPGACDEYITIFLWEQEKERMEIEGLKGRLTGQRAEQEHITVRLMNYDQLLQVGTRDGKTLAAWSLYEYLKRTRLLDEHLRRHDGTR